MSTRPQTAELLAWQQDVWDQMSQVYEREIDPRFAPIVEGVVRRAEPRPNEVAIDLGCGTGSVSLRLAAAGARVRALDISDEMLRITALRAARAGVSVQPEYGSAEKLPVEDGSCDILTAGLSLMFVPDKAAAAREIARVLTPGGRFVASVWGPPERCDIVKFQRLVGQHGPEPPVPDVGPASLADPAKFLTDLRRHGVNATCEEETIAWEHPSLQHVWDSLANVTGSRMSPEQRAAAVADVRAAMWPEPDEPRTFQNAVLYIVGSRRDS